jgi:hypothetical protein
LNPRTLGPLASTLTTRPPRTTNKIQLTPFRGNMTLTVAKTGSLQDSGFTYDSYTKHAALQYTEPYSRTHYQAFNATPETVSLCVNNSSGTCPFHLAMSHAATLVARAVGVDDRTISRVNGQHVLTGKCM